MKLCEITPPPRAKDPLSNIRVDPVTECWLWLGFKHKGYARVRWYGRSILLHRWIFARFVRPLKEHEEVHHKCRNPSCINPKHLEALDGDYHIYITSVAARKGHGSSVKAGDFFLLYGSIPGNVVSVMKRSYLFQDTDGEIHEVEL